VRRLAVLAHYHPLGGVADHVVRQVSDLSASFDRVIVATTSALTDDGRAALAPYADVIERANVGQDFGSWFDGLMAADFAEPYDELLLTNDSYVQVDSIGAMIDRMTDAPVEVWGATKTWRRGEHIQSYFLYFTNPALRSRAFRSFWDSFRPATDRRQAIELHELGISRTMRTAGFRLGGYLVPNPAEKRRATRRGVHWLKRRRHAFPAKFTDLADSDFDVDRRRDPEESRHLNPASVYADSVFDDRRYPLVKFDTLRYDPYWLGSDILLDDCEKRFPDAFADVRRYIDSTARFYPRRPYENGGPAQLTSIQRQRIGYTTEPAASPRRNP
jgi:hypothetical protein